MAAKQWDDLYLRHNFQDTGSYPTAGTLSASPDIIPMGQSALSDPRDLIADENWGRDYGSSTYASQANYIYLRGRNLGETETEGRLSLYYSPGSLLLWPTDPVDPNKGWARHPVSTSFGENFQVVRPKAGERFVTGEGFLWVPEPIYNDHYCLVGRVSTERNPNPIPEVGTLTDFAKYISEHPDMAWRNVVTINPAHPATTTRVNYSQGSEGGEVILVLRCENAPNGSRVEFSCGTTGPDPMIKMAGVVQNTDTTAGPRYNLTLYTTIPDNWTSDVAYTWFSEGKVPLPGMKISLDAVMPAPEDHPVLGSYVRPLTELGVAAEAIPHAGPRTGLRLGSSGMQTLPVAVNGLGGQYGFPRRSTGESSSVLFSGVAWSEKHWSIFGTRTSTVDVGVRRDVVNEVQVETVTLTETDSRAHEAEADTDVDAAIDAVLDTGPYAGEALATLTCVNIPVGSEVWFRNLDGGVTIAAGPAKVTSATKFAISSFIDAVPAGYVATIRSMLRLNGAELPATAELKFAFYEVLPGSREGGKAPKPGKLLGSVTLKP